MECWKLKGHLIAAVTWFSERPPEHSKDVWACALRQAPAHTYARLQFLHKHWPLLFDSQPSTPT